ncbi:hypothetical protein [Nostoc sp. FACHB-133]|nr:hypothetical protein [Nostoc sp. FACHB-133]MBD2525083.1 hypothetical protein [Nostoc sp. FACHB-133]
MLKPRAFKRYIYVATILNVKCDRNLCWVTLSLHTTYETTVLKVDEV